MCAWNTHRKKKWLCGLILCLNFRAGREDIFSVSFLEMENNTDEEEDRKYMLMHVKQNK